MIMMEVWIELGIIIAAFGIMACYICRAGGRATATSCNASRSHKKEVAKRAYNRFFDPEMKLLRMKQCGTRGTDMKK